MILVCGTQDNGGVLELMFNNHFIDQVMVVLKPHNHLPCQIAAGSYGRKALNAVGEFKFEYLRGTFGYRQKECIHSIDQSY